MMKKIYINKQTEKKLDNLTYTINQLFFDIEDNSEVIFEKGTYYFDSTFAYENYTYVTNNDHSLKRMVFPILSKKNITIDGKGSTFIFGGRIIPFFLQNAENIILKNITIDVDRPYFTQGITLEATEEYVLMKIDKEQFPYKIKDDLLVFYGEHYESDFVHEFIEFEPEEKKPIYGCEDFFLDHSVKAEEMEEGVLKIYHNFHRVPIVGKMMVIKHEKRLIPGIVSDHCKKVQLENINIRQAGTMGFVAQYSEDVYLNNVNVATDSQSERVISTNTDATHFVGCKGQILVENCLFESQLDDAINVHGNYLVLHKIIDENKVIAKIGHYQQQGIFGLEIGTSINIIDTNTMFPVEQTVLKDKHIINREYVLLTFDKPVQLQEQRAYCIEDEDAYPQLIFRNNVVRKNRARGLLLSSRNKMVVENNDIISESAAIKISGDTDFWYESGPVSKVMIKNNRIKSVNNNQIWGTAVIDIDPEMLEHVDGKYYHGEIIFENNEISPGERPFIFGHSFNSLRFIDNKYTTKDLNYKVVHYKEIIKD